MHPNDRILVLCTGNSCRSQWPEVTYVISEADTWKSARPVSNLMDSTY